MKVLLLPSCLPCRQKEAGSFPFPLSAGDMRAYAQYTASPGRSVCHSPTLDTPAARCVLCSVKIPFPPRTSPRWHPHPLTHRHDKAPLLYLPTTTQTPPHSPTFISTLRADGTLISVTLREMGFFTVPSKEQFPNSTRELAGEKKIME